MLHNVFLVALIVSLSVNIFFFLFAFIFKTDKLTDFTYGLSFIILTLYSFTRAESTHLGRILLICMILSWALRLMGYLFTRIMKIKKDDRFDAMRNSFWEFIKFWLLQGVAVWIILLPSLYYLTLSNTAILNWISSLGFMIWFVGLLIESIADKQKFDFKNNPHKTQDWIQSGLWKYSRHPNYFGEILLWWGVFLFISPSLSGWYWLTISGPLFITLLLLYGSGIPILEKKYNEKYTSNALYQDYRKNTSLLVPLPPKSL